MVLLDFYFKYYLPAMLTPNETYSEDEKNWFCSLSSDTRTVEEHQLVQDGISETEFKSFRFLENRLINDPNYYKKIAKTTYHIATFKKFNIKVTQVNCVEFQSLLEKGWLYDNIINIRLHIFNKNEKIQIMDITLVEVVLGGFFDHDFLNNFRITASIFVFPVNVNQNHWCLAIADFEKATFGFIDSQIQRRNMALNQSERYYKKFQLFFNFYNKKFNTSFGLNLKIVTYDHAVQTDSYNCGVFVIHFFKQFSKGKALTLETNINDFRDHIKYMILSESENVQHMCPLCCHCVNENNQYNKCDYCKRSFCISCLERNNMLFQNCCYFCKNYTDRNTNVGSSLLYPL